MRYFLAKRHEGPALFVADRIDTLQPRSRRDGLDGQFHPSYTRMVPAHYVVELALVGCPDPDPIYTRFFTPRARRAAADLDEIGRRYIGALADEIAKWLRHIDRAVDRREPIGVASPAASTAARCSSSTYHTMLRLGLSPARLKAFVLNLGDGPDVEQARAFLSAVGLSMFLEEIDATPDDLDVDETLRVLEDYKPLDVECAAMGLLLCRGIRERYPGLAASRRRRRRRREPQGLSDRGEPRAHDPQRRRQPDALPGGLGRRPHQALADLQRRPQPQLRADLRAGAPLRVRRLQPVHAPGRRSRSPKAIPFAALTRYDVPTLYALKGEIVRRGVKAVTGLRHAGLPEAPLPARRDRRSTRCAQRLGGTGARLPPRVPAASMRDARDVALSRDAAGARSLRPRARGRRAAARSVARIRA